MKPKITKAEQAKLKYVERLDRILIHGLQKGGYEAKHNERRPSNIKGHLQQASKQGGYCATEVMALLAGKNIGAAWNMPLTDYVMGLNDQMGDLLGFTPTKLQLAVLLRPLILALHGRPNTAGSGHDDDNLYANVVAANTAATMLRADIMTNKRLAKREAELLRGLIGAPSLRGIFKAAMAGIDQKDKAKRFKRAARLIDLTAHCFRQARNWETGIRHEDHPFTTTNKKKDTKRQ